MGVKRKYKNLLIEEMFHKVENPLEGLPKEQMQKMYREHTYVEIQQITGCTYTQLINYLKAHEIKNEKKRGRRGPNKQDTNGKV